MSRPRTSERRSLLPVLLALPIAALLAWFAVEQVWLSMRAHTPQWSVTLSEPASAMPCDSVIGAGLPDAETLPDPTPTSISSTTAALVVDKVLRARQTASSGAGASSEGAAFPFSSALHLVRATFPDSAQHVAWAQVIGIRETGAFTADAVLIYVDASTGEPLMSVDNITLSDPHMTCPSAGPVFLYWYFWQLVAPGLVVIYLVCLGIVLLIRLVWKRARPGLTT
jgi:hypothetical protein